MEKRNGEPRGERAAATRARCRQASHHALLCPSQGPLSLGGGEIYRMDPQETKGANKGSFLLDFKIPATKEEAAALSWCPSFAPSAHGEVPGGLSSQAPWSWPRHPLQATVREPGAIPSTGIARGSQVRRRSTQPADKRE